MLIKFFIELYKALRSGRDLGLTASQRQSARTFINANLVIDFNGENLLTPKGYLYGTYYFPMSFFIGLYLITYDSLVNINRNFESGYFRTLVEIAGADDSLLSNLTGQSITKYLQQLEIFPVKEVTWNHTQITYFTREQVLDRISALTALEEQNPRAILLREYPDFFRRYGSRDLPQQIVEVLGPILFENLWSHRIPTTEIIKEALELIAPPDDDHRIGETAYPAHAALMLLDEIESRNLRTLEDLIDFGDDINANIRSAWVSNPILAPHKSDRKQIPAEKNRLEAILRT